MYPSRSRGLYRLSLLIAGLVALIVSGLAVIGPATAADTLLSQGKPASASSTEAPGTPASAAFDGNTTGSRWSSAFSDPQWIQVDLGQPATISQVVLTWEAAYGRAFKLQTSADGTTWTDIYSTTTGTGGTQTLAVSGNGRYVRMYGTTRATAYGYSLWEFQVYGSYGTVTPTATPTVTPTGNPGQCTTGFGPNVFIFDPSMPVATIQDRLNQVFTQQETNQFGTQRYALLFKPGTYNVGTRVGFYTQVAGLGMSPDNVVINGPVLVDARWFNGNATQNFWRSVENMNLRPNEGYNRWAVSQAAPFRRMHVQGDMQLDDGGWSSGGFISDSKIDGQIRSGSQQQWFTRNSELGSWSGSVWNMVFAGVTGAPPQNFPNPSHTVVNNAPVTREKPFLYVDGAGNYNVFTPALRTNSRGASWTGGSTAGSSIPISDFCVAKPGDSAATLNAALASGKHLLFTPGIYHLDQPLRVTRANTVILGLGLATLIPDNGVTALQVADVDGVKVAGILIDAGPVNSPTLIEVGPAGSSASHAANPTTLQDVFVRVGGAHVGKATTSVVVNSNNVIGDNLWLWRGDHGTGIGWTTNTADTGLIVNGADVTMYGLFVEHYQKYEVIWNGERGRTYFFQNEFPYDPPNQAAWMNGASRGYAAYKVADSVNTHEAWGVGSYCYFNVNTAVVAERSFEVPVKAGVRFHDLVSVSLGGVGTIAHVVNNTGGPANTANQVIYLVSNP
ncbi:sialidase [Sphaerisporangium album]|uniref:Sialidase n=1 Tax=Sphaerisporangium album TaxID=509200 RepID=A0A367F0Z8_9ACTN|nr:discoidin domain-containing protein [Sphaerisporangium album]RCG24003.1 sialidase [Sphaerisporangium album]